MLPALESQFATQIAELAVPARPFAFTDAETAIVNEPLAAELGLVEGDEAGWIHTPPATRWFIGTERSPGSKPVAQVYAGHQFGHYSPRLGDGRALLLGELRTPGGSLVDVHLKGSGPTAISRGDGFAALGPMLREMLIGEAMHGLKIPTSRALAVTRTNRHVAREGEVLPGAVLTRIAASHVRVGTFQFARSMGDHDLIRRLVRFSLERHAPHLVGSPNEPRALFRHTLEAQARLVASWMLVGFVHGVLNTDNVLVSGEGFDYGPCAFIDTYDPLAVFSSIDEYGRYAYGRQPAITQWNLTRFAEALLPVLDDDEDTATAIAREELARFTDEYHAAYFGGLARKLGLPSLNQGELDIDAFFVGLQRERADMTGTFRALAQLVRGEISEVPGVDSGWITAWRALGDSSGGIDPDLMDRVNPAVIARNHLVEEALEAATAGDMQPFESLLRAVRSPFTPRPGEERFTQPAPDTFGRYITFCGT